MKQERSATAVTLDLRLCVAGAATVTSAPSSSTLLSVRVSTSRTRPGFAVTTQNAPLVGELCRRLDGLPLAIELAAARAAVMPLSELIERLDDRFTLLESATRAADRRHRSLAAALAWSHDLLGCAERALFARLAVFPTAFGLTAATAVCADGELPAVDVALLLGRLVASSMVQLEEEVSGGARYRLLETVRAYAREQLDQPTRAALDERHADHYLAVAQGCRTASVRRGVTDHGSISCTPSATTCASRSSGASEQVSTPIEACAW